MLATMVRKEEWDQLVIGRFLEQLHEFPLQVFPPRIHHQPKLIAVLDFSMVILFSLKRFDSIFVTSTRETPEFLAYVIS